MHNLREYVATTVAGSFALIGVMGLAVGEMLMWVLMWVMGVVSYVVLEWCVGKEEIDG